MDSILIHSIVRKVTELVKFKIIEEEENYITAVYSPSQISIKKLLKACFYCKKGVEDISAFKVILIVNEGKCERRVSINALYGNRTLLRKTIKKIRKRLERSKLMIIENQRKRLSKALIKINW